MKNATKSVCTYIRSIKSCARLIGYTVSLSNSRVHISRVTWHVPENWEVNRGKILGHYEISSRPRMLMDLHLTDSFFKSDVGKYTAWNRVQKSSDRVLELLPVSHISKYFN